MADGRSSCCSNGSEPVYIDVNRIMDSCRDKDCFEDVRVLLTDFGQEIIEHAGAVRTKYARIIGTNLNVIPLPFNRGFYQVNIRVYVKCAFEVCVCAGRPQEIDGLAVAEKSVILYGSEGSVKIYRSDPEHNEFCPSNDPDCACKSNLPVAVLEVVDPVVLTAKIEEVCNQRCCCCCDIPEAVSATFNGNLCDNETVRRILTVSLGFFSVVRIERPGQYLIHATEYSIPEKECAVVEDDDPCSAFRKMCFPTDQFAPPALDTSSRRCGCRT